VLDLSVNAEMTLDMWSNLQEFLALLTWQYSCVKVSSKTQIVGELYFKNKKKSNNFDVTLLNNTMVSLINKTVNDVLQ
jgi:hypothetical protein